MFINSLRWHKTLTKEEYSVVENIISRAEKYKAESKIMKKFYFRLYKVIKNRAVLNMIINSYQNVHYQKRRRFKI